MVLLWAIVAASTLSLVSAVVVQDGLKEPHLVSAVRFQTWGASAVEAARTGATQDQVTAHRAPLLRGAVSEAQMAAFPRNGLPWVGLPTRDAAVVAAVERRANSQDAGTASQPLAPPPLGLGAPLVPAKTEVMLPVDQAKDAIAQDFAPGAVDELCTSARATCGGLGSGNGRRAVAAPESGVDLGAAEQLCSRARELCHYSNSTWSTATIVEGHTVALHSQGANALTSRSKWDEPAPLNITASRVVELLVELSDQMEGNLSVIEKNLSSIQTHLIKVQGIVSRFAMNLTEAYVKVTGMERVVKGNEKIVADTTANNDTLTGAFSYLGKWIGTQEKTKQALETLDYDELTSMSNNLHDIDSNITVMRPNSSEFKKIGRVEKEVVAYHDLVQASVNRSYSANYHEWLENHTHAYWNLSNISAGKEWVERKCCNPPCDEK